MRAAAAFGVAAAGLAAAVQVGPAATWLPPVRRRCAPSLLGAVPAGQVSLSFDDGPHPAGTPAVLDELDRLGWTATFFVLGEQARRHPEIVQETERRGHQVALHGDAHRYLIARSPLAVAADLARVQDTVGSLLGHPATWWRPPYGVLSGPGLLAARHQGVRPVLWSAWGRDWRTGATPSGITEDLQADGLDGSLLLLHDSDVMSTPGSWRTTAASLPLLAERVAERRLVVVPLA